MLKYHLSLDHMFTDFNSSNIPRVMFIFSIYPCINVNGSTALSNPLRLILSRCDLEYAYDLTKSDYMFSSEYLTYNKSCLIICNIIRLDKSEINTFYNEIRNIMNSISIH